MEVVYKVNDELGIAKEDNSAVVSTWVTADAVLRSVSKILLVDIGLTNVPIALVDVEVDVTILKKLRTN